MAVAAFSCQDKGMSDKGDINAKNGRAERLSAALRENLKRRKAQVRILGKVIAKPPEN